MKAISSLTKKLETVVFLSNLRQGVLKFNISNLATFTGLLVLSCNESSSTKRNQFSDQNIEIKARHIAQILDTNSIKIFQEWNFYMRGYEVWGKLILDSTCYFCYYKKVEDTAYLRIREPEKFVLDFPCNFLFDTSKYGLFEFKRHNDSIVQIRCEGTKGNKDDTISQRQSLSNLFPVRNPFAKLATLSALKDSLGVFHITSYNDLGGIIAFGLSAQHILTYVPEPLVTSNKSKNYWRGLLTNMVTINDNWYLRKLDKPSDGG